MEGINDTAQQSLAPGTPLILLRTRGKKAVKSDDGSQMYVCPKEPCDGLMIWIEELK